MGCKNIIVLDLDLTRSVGRLEVEVYMGPDGAKELVGIFRPIRRQVYYRGHAWSYSSKIAEAIVSSFHGL